MKLSEQWLREWVNPAVDSNELSEQLSMAGLEVDGVEPVAADFHTVVVGEVVECGPHPDADKLQVTKVNTNDGELLTFVGAPNCRQGLKVVAKVGAVCRATSKLCKTTWASVARHVVLIQRAGLIDDHEGIIELPADAPVVRTTANTLALMTTALILI